MGKKKKDILRSKLTENCSLGSILLFRSLDKVLPETLEHFREPAQDLIDERGAETALAAAMAVIAGSTKITARSLLSHKEVIIHSYG